MEPGQELAILRDSRRHREAREAAAAIDIGRVHLAARAAGLNEWLSSANRYTMTSIDSAVTTALRMPFPSPAIQALRAEAGFPEGVRTNGASGKWSLAVGKEFADGNHLDTGVRLVCAKRPPGSKDYSLRVPLDITVPRGNLETARTRPDRISVWIGEGELPHHHVFQTEDAQGLLIVAQKFVDILRSGQAAELTTPPRGARRLFGRT